MGTAPGGSDRRRRGRAGRRGRSSGVVATERPIRDILRSLEAATPLDRLTILGYLVGARVELDDAELHATLRRAELLLAAGGNPRRELDLHGRAVSAVADDLDSEAARAQLRDALVDLERETAALPETDAARAQLLADPDLAWQCFARALLADALEG